MLRNRLSLLLAALPLLAACASEAPPERRQSFGPGRVLPGMSPASDVGTFQGGTGWRAAEPSYHPQALPSGYKLQ
jgi:hypothetical protein